MERQQVSDLGYARVSTAAQDCLAQVQRLQDYGCERIWHEHASGAAKERPELTQLLDWARPGDRIVVVRLDRLGRSVPHLIDLVTELQRRGLDLVSLTEAIDTSTATGRLTFAIMAALAQFELDLRSERQQEAWQAGRQKGRARKLTPEKISAIIELRNRGDSLRQIARATSVSQTSVRRALVRE